MAGRITDTDVLENLYKGGGPATRDDLIRSVANEFPKFTRFDAQDAVDGVIADGQIFNNRRQTGKYIQYELADPDAVEKKLKREAVKARKSVKQFNKEKTAEYVAFLNSIIGAQWRSVHTFEKLIRKHDKTSSPKNAFEAIGVVMRSDHIELDRGHRGDFEELKVRQKSAAPPPIDADEGGSLLKPKGHKLRGCKCIICSRQRNPKRAAKKKRAVKRNAGYENQMLGPMRRERKALSRPVRKNSTVRIPTGSSLGVLANPAHFPVGKAGRPAKPTWWIVDAYGSDGKTVASSIEKCSKTEAMAGARALPGCKIKGHAVDTVQLSGPYRDKPTASTVRK